MSEIYKVRVYFTFQMHVCQDPNLIADVASDRHSNTNMNHVINLYEFLLLTTIQANISGYTNYVSTF